MKCPTKPYADMATVTLTGDLELYAQWDKYDNTVTWKNGETTLETDETVAYGSMPSYDGDVPTKASDEENNYVFTGWYPTPGVVTTNVTYSAMFTAVPKAQSLADNADNSTLISTLTTNGGTWNVTLSGRTLYKDGDWNTLCLPFDVSDFTGTPLAGATVKELLTTSNLDGEGKLTLNFSNDLTAIEAGKPYIVKWASGDNIVSPVFNGVTIDGTNRDITFTGGTFMGNYAPLEITDANRDNILLLSGGNKLGYAKTDRTIANGKALGAFHAYFNIPVAAAASSFVINFGDDISDATRLNDNVKIKNDKEADAWYTLGGLKLQGEPTAKGVYIYNGKKVVK